MNEMNSLTHSCMHSLASFAIFAFSGSAVFMIRATGAKLRMLASDKSSCFPDLEGRVVSGRGGDEDASDMIELVTSDTTNVQAFALRRSLTTGQNATCACDRRGDTSATEFLHAQRVLCAHIRRNIIEESH